MGKIKFEGLQGIPENPRVKKYRLEMYDEMIEYEEFTIKKHQAMLKGLKAKRTELNKCVFAKDPEIEKLTKENKTLKMQLGKKQKKEPKEPKEDET